MVKIRDVSWVLMCELEMTPPMRMCDLEVTPPTRMCELQMTPPLKTTNPPSDINNERSLSALFPRFCYADWHL